MNNTFNLQDQISNEDKFDFWSGLFTREFPQWEGAYPPPIQDPVWELLLPITHEVQRFLKNAKSSGPGPDSLVYNDLIPKSFHLTFLSNLLFYTETIPLSFRAARTAPLPKKA